MKNTILASILLLSLSHGTSAPAKSAQTIWKISPETSFIKFHLKNMGLPVSGKFTRLVGDANYDGKNLSQAAVRANIDTSSIETGIGLRDHHLKGKDFFNVSEFPEATFSSSRIEVSPDGNFQILGTLTLHGVSQPITLDAKPLKQKVDQTGHNHLTTSASANVPRKSFGIGGFTAAAISNNVNVDLTIDLVKI